MSFRLINHIPTFAPNHTPGTMSTTATQPVTLHQIWQYHHAADFAAGVRLLLEHNPAAVTNLILDRLQKAAAPGKKPNRYEVGKLSEALQKTRINATGAVNPTPDPSPTGRGDVEHTVANTATSTATNQPTPNNPQPATSNQQPTTNNPSTSPSTSPLPVGEGPGVGLSSPLAKSLHKRHDHIHALMTDAKTDEDRARYAKEIMEDIIPALDREYDRLRAEASAKERPTDEPVAPYPDSIPGPILSSGDARTFKKLQSVRSRISTLRGKIKSEKDPAKKTKWEKELQDKIVERDRLENELA